MVSVGDRPEIAFFDVETTIPTRPGQGFAILEFGAILVCPRKLVELESYSTLVRPTDLSLISPLSVRCNGITKDAVVSASTFAQIADRVYDILHGRIWAGHNILRFDCARIREAFAEINRPPPEPKGTIDSLALLTEGFGRRAGDMKMATLATYFGLGQQTHRSLGDVRMNVEVLKHCATVLFLESSLPEIFTANSWVSPNATTRSCSNGKAFPDGFSMNTNTSSSSIKIENHQISFPANQRIEGNHPTPSLMTPNTGDEVPDHVESNTACPDPFNMGPLSNEVGREPIQSDENMEEESGSGAPEYSTTAGSEGSRGFADFLEPDEVSIPSTSISPAPFSRRTQRICILHKDITLSMNTNACSSSIKIENHQISFPTNQRIDGNHPTLSLMTPNSGNQVSDHAKSNTTYPDAFNMGPLSNEVGREPLQSDETMEEESGSGSPESSTAAGSGASRGFADFLDPDVVSVPSISVSLAPFYRGTQRIHILHKDITLQLCCTHLKVRFGISTKFVDYAGRPRLSFVVDATPNLCQVLDACDSLAQRLNVDAGGRSEWRPVVTRKAGFLNSPTVRLHIPTVADGKIARWVTEIYGKESSTPLQRLVFSRFDVAELDALFTPGTFVDAHFSLDSYDHHQNAGIRLVAKKLILHAN